MDKKALWRKSSILVVLLIVLGVFPLSVNAAKRDLQPWEREYVQDVIDNLNGYANLLVNLWGNPEYKKAKVLWDEAKNIQEWLGDPEDPEKTPKIKVDEGALENEGAGAYTDGDVIYIDDTFTSPLGGLGDNIVFEEPLYRFDGEYNGAYYQSKIRLLALLVHEKVHVHQYLEYGPTWIGGSRVIFQFRKWFIGVEGAAYDKQIEVLNIIKELFESWLNTPYWSDGWDDATRWDFDSRIRIIESEIKKWKSDRNAYASAIFDNYNQVFVSAPEPINFGTNYVNTYITWSDGYMLYGLKTENGSIVEIVENGFDQPTMIWNTPEIELGSILLADDPINKALSAYNKGEFSLKPLGAALDVTTNEGDEITFQAIPIGITKGQHIEWNFGDGQTETGKLETNHIYTDDGIYTVTFTAKVFDGDLIAKEDLIVKVDNVAPQLEVGPDQTVNEGEEFTISGLFYDPGPEDTFKTHLNCEGSEKTYPPVQGGWFEVEVSREWDDDLGYFTDPGWRWEYRVHNTYSKGTINLTDFKIVFGPGFDANNGNYVWNPKVKKPVKETSNTSKDSSNSDSDDSKDEEFEDISGKWDYSTTTNSITWTVKAAADGLGHCQEAVFYFWTEQFGESPDAVEIQASFGSEHEPRPRDPVPAPGPVATMDVVPNGSPHHTLADAHECYGDNGSYLVELKVIDDDGGVGTDFLRMTVTNVKPSVSITNISGDMIAGKEISFSGKYTDPGWLDTHRVTWDFGDGGKGTTGKQTDTHKGYYPKATGSSKITHIYDSEGVYTVTLKVTDDDGGVGTAKKEITILPTTGAKKLSITKVTASPGETITIPVKIDNAEGVAGADLVMTYDSKVLKCTKVLSGSLTQAMNLTSNIGTTGQINITMASSTGLSAGTGSLAKLRFSVKTNAVIGTDTQIGFQKAGVYDVNMQDFTVITQNGKVTIGCPEPTGDVTGDGEINAKDVIAVLRYTVGSLTLTPQQLCAADMNRDSKVNAADAISILREIVGLTAPGKEVIMASGNEVTIRLYESYGVAGESIEVPIKVDNASMLAGGNIHIAYDSSILRAVDVYSKSGMLLASNVSEPGVVRLAVAGIEKLNGETLAKIRFDVLADRISPIGFREVDVYGPHALPIGSRLIDGIFKSWAIPAEYNALLQNYPNPFNPETWIPYQLNDGSEVTIRIFNALGEIVRRLDLGYKPAGIYTSNNRSAYWDSRNESGERVASGVYFYHIQADEFTATRKMLMLK